MKALRFVAFALMFLGATVPIYLATALAELARPGAVHYGARVWARVFRALAHHVLGIQLEVRGSPPKGACIVAAKHQSLYETIVLLDMLDSPAIVLKRELLAVPLWRFFARRHDTMPIDRDQGASALRPMLRTARRVAAAGRAILIFPEGTRVRAGDAPPLKPGVSALYQLLGLPVQPLAVDTAHIWPSDGLPRAGTAVFAFGPPIASGLARAEFEARLHAAVNALQPPPPRA